MVNRRWTLKRALQWIQRYRPEAAPNAGYMAALARLEEDLFGEQTVKVCMWHAAAGVVSYGGVKGDMF